MDECFCSQMGHLHLCQQGVEKVNAIGKIQRGQKDKLVLVMQRNLVGLRGAAHSCPHFPSR